MLRDIARYKKSVHLQRRSGRVVDRNGLENRRTARYRGFESLLLRQESESRRYSFTTFFIVILIPMDYLPHDPAILVSSINMLLRDEEFDSLESLCSYYDKSPEEILNYLHDHGYVYSEEQKQMRPIGFDE